MKFNKNYNVWEDEQTGLTYHTKQGLIAKVKRFNLDIPEHPYLSNRFVIHRININVGEEEWNKK